MSDLTKELHEELEAFDPKWKEHYDSIAHAARAADVGELYGQWLVTPDGRKYTSTVVGLPDHVGESRKEAAAMQAPASLPFGYSNIGWVPNAAWGEDK